MNDAFWRGRRVFITGHTGFKGSWLALWLGQAGARITGYSTIAPTMPALFDVARVEQGLEAHHIGDIREGAPLRDAMIAAAPEVVFHMAAQPLVRQSYLDPIETYAVNVIGTANVLEAVRWTPSVQSVVSVTTDKCYENNEWDWGYRENEALGGHDPYSSSKACAELVTAAYRRSFLAERGVAVGSARAGNVIGGGDWAVDRLLPDILRALDAKAPLQVRYAGAIRPWQHVLEPLSGYIALAEALVTDGGGRASAWNFGPADTDAQPVEWILDYVSRKVPEFSWILEQKHQVHEASYLKLDSSKARRVLNWSSRWTLSEALDRTIDWHVAWRSGEDMRAACLHQIAQYAEAS